jgi:hypothetical protein
VCKIEVEAWNANLVYLFRARKFQTEETAMTILQKWVTTLVTNGTGQMQFLPRAL